MTDINMTNMLSDIEQIKIFFKRIIIDTTIDISEDTSIVYENLKVIWDYMHMNMSHSKGKDSIVFYYPIMDSFNVTIILKKKY